MCNSKPIFIFSTERSGTNLLRAILSSHSNIASPPPSGIINTITKNRYRYFNSIVGNRIHDLISDTLKLIEAHPSNWNMAIKEEDILARMKTMSYWEMYRSINEIYGEQNSAEFWLSKEPNLFDWGYELLAHMPNSKFIYLVRDGRDVAASMLRKKLHEKHVYFVARRWRNDQVKCLQYMSDPIFSKNIIVIHYEDLIENSGSVINSLSNFIGIKFEESMLEFYKNQDIKDHSKRSIYWKNLSKPIIADNKNKYRQYLSKYQISIFESVARDILCMLGYRLENIHRKPISSFEIILFHVYQVIVRYQNSLIKNKEKKIRKNYEGVTSKIENRFSNSIINKKNYQK